MKIVVAGRTGQVAMSLAERMAASGIASPVFLSRSELDFEMPQRIGEIVESHEPDVIINAAAWTAVDLAEDEPERAHTVNAIAPGALAKAAKNAGACLVHLSTDYVFDGSKNRPYTETDPTNPQSVYGQTKLEGEESVRETHDRHIILRTAWVYSPFGNNFLKTMLSLAGTRDHLRVVGDQMGNPTSALDIADAIVSILGHLEADPEKGTGKTYHCTGSGEASWADFARHIFEVSRECGGPFAEVEGIGTDEWPTKAARPANSRLDCTRLKEMFGVTMPDWRSSVRDTVMRLEQKDGSS